AFGSHTRVRRKSKPNLCLDRTELCQSSNTMSTVIRTTVAANKNVTRRAISSPSRRRVKNEREPATGPALGTVVLALPMVSWLLDLVESVQFLADDFFRQFGVGQCFGVVLTVRKHPLHKILDRIALAGVRKLGRDQQPRKAGDRISRFAGRVRD